VSHDAQGYLISHLAKDAGIDIPNEIALLGVDNSREMCELCQPPLSSISLDTDRIGREAVRIVVDLLAGRRAPTRPVTVAPLEVVPRGSTEMVAVDDRDMKRAVLFIRSHAVESIDVGDLLKAVPISRRSLEAKFRRHFNRTPSEEIRRLRLEKARHLLSHTAIPMAEVARQSGFSSARYLAMAFRREVGTSPQAYRRRSAGALSTAPQK